MYAHSEIQETAGAVVELADLALKFGRIDRTCVRHPNGLPESDSDHTVMLAWIAPCLAEIINRRVGYQRHNTYRVAAYAAVHDAVEVHAGDTPTLKISEDELAAKEVRESDAARLLHTQFYRRLPWFAQTVRAYEAQADADARLVRSVDKAMPKAVHVINKGHDLVEAGVTLNDFRALAARQREQIVAWGNDELVRKVYDELAVLIQDNWPYVSKGKALVAQHLVVVAGGRPALIHPSMNCLTDCDVQDAFDNWKAWTLETLNDGEYPVDVGDDGYLVFNGKQD